MNQISLRAFLSFLVSMCVYCFDCLSLGRINIDVFECSYVTSKYDLKGIWNCRAWSRDESVRCFEAFVDMLVDAHVDHSRSFVPLLAFNKRQTRLKCLPRSLKPLSPMNSSSRRARRSVQQGVSPQQGVPAPKIRDELTQCQGCWKSKGQGISLRKCKQCQMAVYCVSILLHTSCPTLNSSSHRVLNVNALLGRTTGSGASSVCGTCRCSGKLAAP